MERAPNPWDRFYRFQVAPWRGERPIAELRPWLGAGRVLELGCGNGKLLGPLQAAGIDAVGLDISWNVLQRLQTGVLADASALPFTASSFTAILDIHCTGHLDLDGRARAMREIARCLEPTGHLVCERLGRLDMRATKGAEVGEFTRQLEDGRSTHFSSDESLRQDLEAAGMEVLESVSRTYTQKVAGGRAQREAVRAVARAN